jgi:hypothetical protein
LWVNLSGCPHGGLLVLKKESLIRYSKTNKGSGGFECQRPVAFLVFGYLAVTVKGQRKSPAVVEHSGHGRLSLRRTNDGRII